MKALLFERKVARYAVAAAAGRLLPGKGAAVGPLRLADVDAPKLPGDDWLRVRPRLSGICGSDLATIDGYSSRYFEPIVSFPFTPGHEVVGDLDDGRRVVVVPILTCVTRGIDPLCRHCANSEPNLCERTAFGHLDPGLQTGYCASTGGGWGIELAAHRSQLVDVPDHLTDEEAVLVEPTACAVHAAAAVERTVPPEGAVAVIGSGTLGLLTIAALRDLNAARPILATARYAHQTRLARALGASVVCAPGALARHVRSITGAWLLGGALEGDAIVSGGGSSRGRLTGGVPGVVDCVGSADSLQQALDVCAPGGTVHAVGMPGHTTLDLTGLWHRELSLQGSYAYRPSDFAVAVELVQNAGLGRLVTNLYPLSRYVEAIEHAANAGSRGAVKVAFDLRAEKERNR